MISTRNSATQPATTDARDGNVPIDEIASGGLYSDDAAPATGWFDRFDPFEGIATDPQSLHKYTYTHNDPINNTDPTGLFSVGQTIAVAGIGGLLNGIVSGGIAAIFAEQGQRVAAFSDAFSKGTISGAITATILVTSRGRFPVSIANSLGNAAGSLIVDGIRVSADVYFGNKPKEAGEVFRSAAIDGLAGLIVGGLFGKLTKGGDDLAEAFEGYARSLNNARFKILPREGAFATEAAKLKAVVARNTAVKNVDEMYRILALELGSLFTLDSTLGNVVSGGITWVWDSAARVNRAIDRAMDRFEE